MTAWDVIRQLQAKKPDFFEDCIDGRILLNEEEYPQSRRVENNNDFFSENNETFPKEIFPRELSKLDFPTIDYEAIDAKVVRNGTDALA